MHVDEAVRVRVAVGMRERGAKLFQRVRPERRKSQQAANLQHAPEFRKHARRIVGPMEREVAPDHVESDAAKRQRVDVGADEHRRRCVNAAHERRQQAPHH